MADIIQLLPDALANQIAAGEVIQRPASAVKELLENSIDAGATMVQLIVRDAGKTLLQVVDNGCGMSETDARMSFERHATSKIRKIDDLFAIRTMGFRGEALASIAAVAQVELKTRQCGDTLGTYIRIEGSEVKQQEPCQCPEGTSLSIKNLFYNVPARRNFLKSNPVELKHIIEEFQRVAMAHPTIGFSLHHNEHELFHLKAGNIKQRIVGMFGKGYDGKLVPVDEQVDFIKITGFIGKPDSAKKTRGDQYFFINNRFVKNNYLNHAVFMNYEDLIPREHFPFFCLYIEIDPTRIDINVHPTKQEIKFDDERSVYGFVRVSVRHALGKYSVTPSLDFNQEQGFNILQAFGDDSQTKPREWPREDDPQQFKTMPSAGNSPTYRDTSSSGRSFDSRPRETPIQKNNRKNWEDLYELPEIKQSAHDHVTIESDFERHEQVEGGTERLFQGPADRTPTQLHNRYIISPIRSGFILIDQQAAHERIQYEHILKHMSKPQGSQQLLFPQTIECAPQDAALLREILPEINGLGFDIQEFGNHDFVIHGMPADLKGGNEQQIVESMLEDFKNNLAVLKLDKRESLARSLARQTSIKAGQSLTVKEMETLIDELFACEQPYIAPGGRQTISTFDFKELDGRFAAR